MLGEKLVQHSPLRAIAATIRGGLDAGQVAGVFARAGVGKSALLIHVALGSLLRGAPALHVSLSDGQARVRAWYEEIVSEIARAAGFSETAQALLDIERHRVIHSCLGRSFGPADLSKLLATLTEVMAFHPTVVVVDYLDASDVDAEGWREVARAAGVRLWLGVRVHRDHGPDATALAERFDTAIALEPREAHVALRVLRVNGEPQDDEPLHLDPVTMVVRPEDAGDPITAPPSPHPGRCTLYSGGAEGAEAAFGTEAEKWGVTEVNFTFEGHVQARTRGRRLLTEQELKAGAVSLLYVSNRLHRKWDRSESLRRVLQVQWHVVSHARQVFVVGAIQDDNTVHGGTGWAVELARRFHKNVWVFDQGAQCWFQWSGETWAPGLPVIESPDFAGTGTRFLSDDGRDAIADLFTRSFGE